MSTTPADDDYDEQNRDAALIHASLATLNLRSPMTTYSESIGEQPFDWHQALENPEEYDFGELCRRARNWPTCACGNQCSAIPRMQSGAPIDSKLWNLGDEFSLEIHRSAWHHAKLTLAKIEARSAELLAAMKQPSDR